jgi:glycosyltransferase involved in cell wall biosynthesis
MRAREGQQRDGFATEQYGGSAQDVRPEGQSSAHALASSGPVAPRPTRFQILIWVVPIVALGLAALASLWLAPGLGVKLVAGYVVAVLLALVLRRPQWALFIFIVALPLHNLSMAFLLAQTGSIGFVKLIQPWKELIVAVALARVLVPMAYRALRRRPWAVPGLRVTPLDVVMALFVLLCAISVALPNHLIPLTGRLYGFRDLAMPLAVYALGRLAPLTRRDLMAVVTLIGLDVAAFAIVAIGERAIWGNDLLLAVDYGNYIKVVFGSTFPLPHNTPWTFYTAGFLPRAGSLAVGPLDVSILMLIALPILLVVASARSEFARRWTRVALALTTLLGGAALVLAWGRESLVLVILEFALVVWLARPRWQWKGVALALAGGVAGGVLLVSVAAFVIQAPNDHARIHLANTGLVRLIAQEQNGQLTPSHNRGGAGELLKQSSSGRNASTVGHLQSLVKLSGAIVRHPQGYGIGTSGQVGNRFANTDLGGETSYLSVGVELGVLGLLLYLALFAGAIFACWRAVRSHLPLLERTVLLGVAIAWVTIFLDGIFTEVTLNTFAMFFLFWMAGAAVTLVQRSRVVPALAGEAAPFVAVRPLRVAMDAQSLRTARTGVRTYVDELLRQFARPDQPHRVVSLAGPPRLPATNRLFRILNQLVAVPWLHLWLPTRLWLSNYDVLFSPEYLTPAWTPVPRVVTFHDAMFLRRPQDYNPLWLAVFRRVSLPALRRSDAIIVVSEYSAEDVAARARLRRARIHVVPLGGPRATETMGVPSDTLARFGVEPGKYVLHVGVLERRKNLVTLVRAFGLWRQQGAPDGYKLVLAGQPGPRPDLDDSRAVQEVIAELDLGQSVVLTGHIVSEDRDTLYRQAGVVAIPSTLEGFGLPVLEAFAAGVPVVAARATSLPEVAGDGALFFDPEQPQDLADCLARVVSDPEQRASLLRAGAARLPRFTWERCAHGTYGVFEAAVLRAYATGTPPTVDGEGHVVWRG